MLYADADFFLAIAKPDDWLKSRARKILNEHSGEIYTSAATILELALVCRSKGWNVENVVGSAFEISKVEGLTESQAMQAAHLIQDEGFGVFDSFHAVLSGENPVISSDHAFEKMGKQVIKL